MRSLTKRALRFFGEGEDSRYRLLLTSPPDAKPEQYPQGVTVTTYRVPRGSVGIRSVIERQVRRKTISVGGEPALWKLRGWTKKGQLWQGSYKVGLNRWRGSAEESDDGFFKFYIQQPPEALLDGPHRSCYVPKGAKGYYIHFVSLKPRSLSEGIGGVELQLAMAIQPKGANHDFW